ncbi:Ig-like domain-containing protein, partial [Arthrospira platensis SPKY1]|nr:Ig-like domain-containing protein [Arthrospira platensis SPKY1]
ALSNKQFSTIIDVENEGSYTVTVSVSDKAGNTQSKNVAIQFVLPSVDTDGPSIVVLTPQNGSYINNPNLSVSGTVIDPSGISSLQISLNDGAYGDISEYIPGTGAFSHSIVLENDGIY